MARYIDIKSIDELNTVQKKLHQEIKEKGNQVSSSFSNIRSFYRPGNMLSVGIRSITDGEPVDSYLINFVRKLIRRRSE